VRQSSEYWMGKSPLVGGGVGGFGKGKGHHCYTANMARGLIRLGYEDDPRVRKTLDWLVKTAHPKGGWTCRFAKDGPAPSRTLDAVQPDRAPAAARWYAEHPNQRPTPLAFETAGLPSKMITLRALTVLSRIVDRW